MSSIVIETMFALMAFVGVFGPVIWALLSAPGVGTLSPATLKTKKMPMDPSKVTDAKQE